MNSYTLQQIDHFTHEAKRLERSGAIRHSEALDRVAAAHGSGNWSLLMKHRASAGKSPATVAASAYGRTEDDLQDALRKVPAPRFGSTEPSVNENGQELMRPSRLSPLWGGAN